MKLIYGKTRLGFGRLFGKVNLHALIKKKKMK